MNKRLSRYFKRVIAFISAFVVFFAGIYLTSFYSEAVGYSSSLTFNVNYPQPYCSDTTGYVCIVYKGSSNENRLNTLFWSMEPETNEVFGTDFTNVMDITLTRSTIRLDPYVLGGSYWYNLYEFSSADSLGRIHSGYHNSASGSPSWSYNYGNIVAVLFNGNVGAVNTTGIEFETPVIHWSNSSDSTQIYNYMWQILQSLQGVEGDTTEIISKLNSILSENVSTNQKLEDIKALYEQLIDEQEKSNTWLEKIYNKIVEALGLQGEESTEKLPDEEVDSVLEEEDQLMQDTTDAENSLDFSVDSNSNNVVWNVIERVLNANPRVFGAFIGIMTLGVITLLLNR